MKECKKKKVFILGKNVKSLTKNYITSLEQNQENYWIYLIGMENRYRKTVNSRVIHQKSITSQK